MFLKVFSSENGKLFSIEWFSTEVFLVEYDCFKTMQVFRKDWAQYFLNNTICSDGNLSARFDSKALQIAFQEDAPDFSVLNYFSDNIILEGSRMTEMLDTCSNSSASLKNLTLSGIFLAGTSFFVR